MRTLDVQRLGDSAEIFKDKFITFPDYYFFKLTLTERKMDFFEQVIVSEWTSNCVAPSTPISFLRSWVRRFVRSLVRRFVRSLVRRFVRPFVRSFIHSFIHSLKHLFIHLSFILFVYFYCRLQIRLISKSARKGLNSTSGAQFAA